MIFVVGSSYSIVGMNRIDLRVPSTTGANTIRPYSLNSMLHKNCQRTRIFCTLLEFLLGRNCEVPKFGKNLYQHLP